MAGVRAFLAVHPAPEALRAVARFLDELRRPVAAAGLSVSWVRPEHMHITLKFLGDMDEEELRDLAQALRAQLWAEPPAKVHVALRGLGAFPSLARPRVLHSPITDENGGEPTALRALASRVEEIAAARGHARQERSYKPHLTLGRVRAARGHAGLGALFQAQAGRALGPAALVQEIVLYESRLSRSGPTYLPRERIALSEASASSKNDAKEIHRK